MKSNQNIQLSISLLVSNSIDTIRKCMESLVPILKNIPSELIVVDTGGTDGSIEIAKEYADLIVPFTWCNDFAKARNAGLEKAKGEWFLYLDDDEWFEDVSEIITFFKSKEYLQYKSAIYPVRNYQDRKGSRWTESRCHRMVKITKETKFVSPIHEVLTPRPLPQKFFNCFAHHYGYVFENEEERIKHCDRNISLLEEVLKKEKNDQRLRMQLAQEYGVLRNYEKTIEVSKESIKIVDKQHMISQVDIIYSGWNMKNIVYTEILNENVEQAYKEASKYIEYKWINTITKNNLSHALARLANDFAKEEDCFKYLEIYLKTYQKLMNDEILRKEETLVDQSETLTEESYFSTLLAGILSAYRIRNKANQQKYLIELSKSNFFNISREDFSIIISILVNIEDKKERSSIMNTLMEKGSFRRQMLDLMENQQELNQEELLELVSNNGDTYKEFIPYRILYYYQQKISVKELVEKYFMENNNILFFQPEVMDIFVDEINLLDYANRMSLEDWLKNINIFTQKASVESLWKACELCKKQDESDIRLPYLKNACYEKLLQVKETEGMEFSILENLLFEYVNSNLTLFGSLYREEVFTTELEIYLPETCRFCNRIQAIYEEGMDDLAKVRIIREAVDLCPDFAAFCKSYIDKMQQETEAATREFLQLAVMIKKSIRSYIAVGQLENARMTLMQLEQLIPNDPEIGELKRMVENNG